MIQPAGTVEGREGVVVVRCPRCRGLRAVTPRSARRPQAGVCQECYRGRCIPISDFYSFWTERFTHEEIDVMGRAIWG